MKINFGPEYPSLTDQDRAEGAGKRLNRSKKKFNAANRVVILESNVQRVVGEEGDFKHSNMKKVNEWLSGWRIPEDSSVPDIETSAAVFVGIVESEESSETSPMRQGPPFIKISSDFVDKCWRLSETFPCFSILAGSSSESPDVVDAVRKMVFEHIDPKTVDSDLVVEVITETKDLIFSERVTSAAVRWGIAHEMSHAVGRESGRKAAYERAREIYPDLEKIWFDILSENDNRRQIMESYRDEVGCDILAIDSIINSPFSREDIMTQACGGLLALVAIMWDGYLIDKSKFSATHPSPSLRFEISYRYWVDKLFEADTWKKVDPVTKFGIDDFALFYCFKKWCGGSYKSNRMGVALSEEAKSLMDYLYLKLPLSSDESVFIRDEGGLSRAIKDEDMGSD